MLLHPAGRDQPGIFRVHEPWIWRGDHETCVLENYRRICYVVGIYAGDLVFPIRLRGPDSVCGPAGPRERIVQPVEMEEVDGLITDRSQVALVTLYADCVPLYFLDPTKKVIGLAHSGWRGRFKKSAVKWWSDLSGFSFRSAGHPGWHWAFHRALLL
ncbi:MAG: laccase domain-containing protein [Clostridia bacterium]